MKMDQMFPSNQLEEVWIGKTSATYWSKKQWTHVAKIPDGISSIILLVLEMRCAGFEYVV